MDVAALDDLLSSLDEPKQAPTQDDVLLPLLVVRVHRITYQQGLRVCKWAKALLRIAVLADVTLPPGSEAVALLKSLLAERMLQERVTIHTFTSDDMEERYPNLRHPSLEAFAQHHIWMRPALSHAWAYTAEGMVATGLGDRQPRQQQQQQHVWFFEHDCDWAGDVSELIAEYADDQSDLSERKSRSQQRLNPAHLAAPL